MYRNFRRTGASARSKPRPIARSASASASGVGGKGPRIAPEHVARELVENDHRGETALGRLLPVGRDAGGEPPVERAEPCTHVLVDSIVDGEPLLGRELFEPERKYPVDLGVAVRRRSIVQRQPHRRPVGIGPGDPVAGVGGDPQPVAGSERARFAFSLEQQLGGAGEQHHPFVPVLVEPFADRRRLAGGDDPLEAQPLRLDERVEPLGVQPRRHPGQQVAGLDGRSVSVVGVHRFKRRV